MVNKEKVFERFLKRYLNKNIPYVEYQVFDGRHIIIWMEKGVKFYEIEVSCRGLGNYFNLDQILCYCEEEYDSLCFYYSIYYVQTQREIEEKLSQKIPEETLWENDAALGEY